MAHLHGQAHILVADTGNTIIVTAHQFQLVWTYAAQKVLVTTVPVLRTWLTAINADTDADIGIMYEGAWPFVALSENLSPPTGACQAIANACCSA